MAHILLCHPLFLSQNRAEQELGSPYFPLGLLYLAGYVRENGHRVSIFDGTFQPDESTFADRLTQEKPDVVGISVLQPTRETALRLAQTAREQGIPVIVGGPDPTLDPGRYAAEATVDLVVHHEGEQTILSVLDAFDQGVRFGHAPIDPRLACEPGIAFREADGTVVVNQPRPPIENLDALPLPARDLIDMERYLAMWREENGYASLTLATSRGCPYGCDWCRDSVHGTELRQRSPESVAAEMAALKATYAIDRLRFVDDVDGLDRGWFEALSESAEAANGVLPFEALYDLKRQDLPLLDVRDSL